ncbi:MAG: CRTAC1 family protein [Bryobacterales bacterium]
MAPSSIDVSIPFVTNSGWATTALLLPLFLAPPPLCHAQPAPPPILFEDVASEAGVEFVLQDGSGSAKYQIETMVGGVAVFDFNRDGLPDIYFANGAEPLTLEKTHPRFYNRLFRNDGEGKFTDVTEQAHVRGAGHSIGVATGDYDNDGYTDIFVAGVNRNALYRNRGDGTFEDVTGAARLDWEGPGPKPWSVAGGWFDFDNDGLLDLFVVNYVSWSAESDPPCTTGGARTYCHPKHYKGLPNQLFRNNGDGTFSDVSAPTGIAASVGKGMSVSFLDANSDGVLDVFVTNDTVPNALFFSDRKGGFREDGLVAGIAFNDDGQALSSMGTDAADFDNDGREDIFVVAIANQSFPLFRNSGHGLFEDVTYTHGIGPATIQDTGWGAGIRDLNNDGYRDLFVAAGAIDDNVEAYSSRASRLRNRVLAGSKGGRFTDLSDKAGPDFQQLGRHRGAAFGDFNQDGLLDVVVTRIGEKAELFLNRSRPTGNWVELALEGAKSNRSAIGALARVRTASGRVLWGRVSSAGGYASANDLTLHFGLGEDAIASEIEITWPRGTVQRLEQVRCGQRVQVREP